MKKLNKISLHNLSQAEMASREQNLVRGGYTCACASVCMDDACICKEDISGNFSTSNSAMGSYIGGGASDSTNSPVAGVYIGNTELPDPIKPW